MPWLLRLPALTWCLRNRRQVGSGYCLFSVILGDPSIWRCTVRPAYVGRRVERSGPKPNAILPFPCLHEVCAEAQPR